MNAATFDTHFFVKRLVGAGMTEPQAEAVVDAVTQTTSLPDVSQLATKDELRAEALLIRSELKAETAILRGEIKGLRGELIWWIIGTGVVGAVAHLFIK